MLRHRQLKVQRGKYPEMGWKNEESNRDFRQYSLVLGQHTGIPLFALKLFQHCCPFVNFFWVHWFQTWRQYELMFNVNYRLRLS